MNNLIEQITTQCHELSSCQDSEILIREYMFELDIEGKRHEVRSTLTVTDWDLKWDHDWDDCPDEYETIESMIEAKL
jgi:hypothetical protein